MLFLIKRLEIGFDEIDLEADYDPEKYDQEMSNVFNDDYYQSQDPQKKPVFDDDIDISDLTEKQEKQPKSSVKSGKKNAVHQSFSEALSKGRSKDKDIDSHLEEIYKLEYEDMVRLFVQQ